MGNRELKAPSYPKIQILIWYFGKHVNSFRALKYFITRKSSGRGTLGLKDDLIFSWVFLTNQHLLL